LVSTVDYDPRVEKDLKAIDPAMQREILDYMDNRIATDEDPRRFGNPCAMNDTGCGIIAFGITGSFAKFGKTLNSKAPPREAWRTG
jgi:hypothetical protein